MNRQARGKITYIALKTSLDNSNWAYFHFLKQNADKITRNFFSAVHISFLRQSRLVCLKNWFMQFTLNITCIATACCEKYTYAISLNLHAIVHVVLETPGIIF